MLALQAITPERLASAVPQVSLAEARKLIAQVHRGDAIAATSAIRRSSAEAVRAIGSVPSLDVIAETPSAIDPFVKYLLAAPDDARFEAVRIPLEHPDRFCVCVSSQVGCALACSFCATGRLGLTRNLAAWEIVEQVRVVRARLPRGRVHGVVFQGRGEPLANLDEVLAACADHARTTGLAPLWAVTRLDGINDSDDDARAVSARARAFADETGVRPRISIIAYNAIGSDDPYRRSARDAEYRAALGIPSHRRYSGGSDVGAACGQLALRG